MLSLPASGAGVEQPVSSRVEDAEVSPIPLLIRHGFGQASSSVKAGTMTVPTRQK